ncbi:MAG TPA: 2-oxoacid:acceptor oxidoreductase [Ruminococcaceae bacterium]|nr:2-oxoacid:acceptor oxidoreductase [Oscillospiraceae bacterium]
MPKMTVNENICKGCALCTTVCPKGIVVMGKTLNAKGYHTAEVTDMSLCIGCAMCGIICPDSAITVEK